MMAEFLLGILMIAFLCFTFAIAALGVLAAAMILKHDKLKDSDDE